MNRIDKKPPAESLIRRIGPQFIVATLVLLTACGPVVTTSSTITTTTTTTLTTTTSRPTTTTTTTASTTSLPEPTTTTISSSLEIGEWDGELIDIGPLNGAMLAVVGVNYNDVLNVREGPGSEFAVVTVLDPIASDVSALGLTWSNPGSLWFAVDIGGLQGWASSSFLSHKGDMVDVTAQVIDRLGENPASGSLIELGLTVAEAMASDEPPSAIEQPAPVVVGEVGEMVVDVIGLGDDSVAGFRLRVVADDVDGTWVLDRVEATLLCIRGVDDHGRCA